MAPLLNTLQRLPLPRLLPPSPTDQLSFFSLSRAIYYIYTKIDEASKDYFVQIFDRMVIVEALDLELKHLDICLSTLLSVVVVDKLSINLSNFQVVTYAGSKL